jgi:hypothetical protein
VPSEMSVSTRPRKRPSKSMSAPRAPLRPAPSEERLATRRPTLLEKLRGPRSMGYFLVFLGVALIIQGFHALEHIVQTMQVFVFGVPRAQAGGILGSAIDFPWVHFTYNFVYFLALVWLVAWAFGLGGFRRFDRLGLWLLIIAAGIQTYHAGEHVIQIAQEAAVGTPRPAGFIGLFADNVIVHLILNLVEWVLPFIAFVRFGGIGVLKEWLLHREVKVPSAA